MTNTKNKRGQEEIVGFAIIVIIVSIILVFFLVFSLSERTSVESYETESFLQSSLYYTTECKDNGRHLPVQDLIFSCYNEENCDNEQEACAVLNETLEDMLKESWPVGPDFPAKGYKLDIFSGEESIISLKEGNVTGSYRGAQQLVPKGVSLRIQFNVYY